MITSGAEQRIAAVEEAIRSEGWTLRYVEWCEDARTPGLLGHYRGVTDRALREVKISTKATPTPKERAEVLEHELRHVREPEWDCGNRPVLAV